ncbi:MAG: glycosyltransferase, partial [Opitutales bacterium]|nr:glycosyltransferase [Opitutales bacterium]
YVGALTQSYDLGTIIRAAAILKEKKNPFEVHFAGSGNQENSLQSLASQLGVGEICQFHGFLNSEKLKDLLDSCDVGLNCILPGLDITMPHKLSDYICSGLPVINSLPGEAQSLLVNWQCGIFYQAGNAPSLSSAMLSLAQKDQRQNASVNAQNLARNLFDRSESYLRWAERIIALNDE